jgi:hypothetical protein
MREWWHLYLWIFSEICEMSWNDSTSMQKLGARTFDQVGVKFEMESFNPGLLKIRRAI